MVLELLSAQIHIREIPQTESKREQPLLHATHRLDERLFLAVPWGCLRFVIFLIILTYYIELMIMYTKYH